MSVLRTFFIWVVLNYLRWWAWVGLWIGRPVVIGIAGSVGKSSTKDILTAMLQDNTRVVSTYGNSETGVPLGILGQPIRESSPLGWLITLALCPLGIFHLRGIDYLVVEMGTDEPNPPKNMEYLLSIVQPNFSLLLNTFPVHTQQFSSVLNELDADQLQSWSEDQRIDYVTRAIAEEDAKIISQNPSTVGIYNADNHWVSEQMLNVMTEHPLTTLHSFGQPEDCEIRYGAYQITPSGSRFELIIEGQPTTVSVDNYLLPEVYREGLAAALLVGRLIGFTTEQLLSSFGQHFHLPKGRATTLAGQRQTILLDSTYNASTSSVLAFLDMLSSLKQQTNRPAVVVLGDMRELGLAEEAEHHVVAEKVAEVADRVYLVGKLTQQFVQPMLAKLRPDLPVLWFANSVELGQELITTTPESSLILFKGSQNTIFLEEAVKAMLADEVDASRLCRQEDFWLERKKAWFASNSNKG